MVPIALSIHKGPLGKKYPALPIRQGSIAPAKKQRLVNKAEEPHSIHP